MIERVVELAARVAELERRQAAALRPGRVVAVDPAAATVDLDLGEGLTMPGVPYAQQAGALAIHAPPSAGQQMMVHAPGGDLRRAVAQPMTWGGGNAAPGATSEANVAAFGSMRLTLRGDALVIETGGAVVTVSAEGVSVAGGDVEAQGVSLREHVHGGVATGPGDTDEPK